MKSTIEINQHEDQNGVRISAAGDLIITNASQLQDKIDGAIENGNANIILDLTGVNYIDSFGIGVVVKSKSQIDKLKGRFKIVISQSLQTIFAKCHLDDYFDLEFIDVK